MQNPAIYPKEKVIKTILALNRKILKDFIQLKQEFESINVPNNEISNKFKTWKPKFEESVGESLKQIQEFWTETNSIQEFNFSLLVKQLTKTYVGDQQYTEAIKCLNSTTDMIKDYIRLKAIKDPTTSISQKQLGSSQLLILDSAKSLSL